MSMFWLKTKGWIKQVENGYNHEANENGVGKGRVCIFLHEKWNNSVKDSCCFGLPTFLMEIQDI